MKPLAPERYKIQFTVSRETYQQLRRAQDLLRHTVPDGNPAIIFERALAVLVTDSSGRRSVRPSVHEPPGPGTQPHAMFRHQSGENRLATGWWPVRLPRRERAMHGNRLSRISHAPLLRERRGFYGMNPELVPEQVDAEPALMQVIKTL